MNRLTKYVLGLMGILVIGMVGLVGWASLAPVDKVEADKQTEEKQTQKPEETNENQGIKVVEAEPNKEKKAEGKYAERVKDVSFVDSQEVVSERIFEEALHYMTHQKVEAPNKWGELQITKQRIDNLLAILDKADYEDGAKYKKYLQEWKNGNFRNAVQLHNHIWTEQEGNMGKATGLMSEAEEQDFIRIHFR